MFRRIGVIAAVSVWTAITGAAEPFRLNLPANPVSDHVTTVGGMAPRERRDFAQLDGPGCIRRIWFVQDRPNAPDRFLSHATGKGIPGGAKPLQNRKMVIRIYFDNSETSQVESPVGDFFGVLHGQDFYEVNTPFISVKPANGYTCYFAMPFAQSVAWSLKTGRTPVPCIFKLTGIAIRIRK